MAVKTAKAKAKIKAEAEGEDEGEDEGEAKAKSKRRRGPRPPMVPKVARRAAADDFHDPEWPDGLYRRYTGTWRFRRLRKGKRYDRSLGDLSERAAVEEAGSRAALSVQRPEEVSMDRSCIGLGSCRRSSAVPPLQQDRRPVGPSVGPSAYVVGCTRRR